MTAGAGSGPGRGVRPGQEGWAAVLFTTLGMLAVMNKILRLLEAEMKMDELVQGFMVASLGVQLVEPFYANTISSTSTHSSLKKFFISLYESMEDNLEKDFFTFANPVFRGVDWELFDGVKATRRRCSVWLAGLQTSTRRRC